MIFVLKISMFLIIQEIMASSLGTSVEEMMSSNEELQRQIDTLKNDNTKLTSVLKKINSNNENQVQQINSQTSEINAMKEEITELKAKNHRLKVSGVGIT